MPSTDWKEQIPEGEEALFKGFAEQLRELQRKQVAKYGEIGRALHTKPNAGLEATFTVLSDLPEHARIGLFARPASYRAWVRFSNGTGKRQADRQPDLRGIAIKVAGVEGKKLIPGMEDAKTQDFLGLHIPAASFRDVAEFVALIQSAENQVLMPFRLAKALGVGRAFTLLRSLLPSLLTQVPTLATRHFYSAAPIQYGPYAVHFALFPCLAQERGGTPKSLGEELSERLKAGPISYEFRVQFFCDEQKTPLEDPSVEWKEADAPFLTVGRLTLSQQDTSSERGQRIAQLVERFSFDPWHALMEHKPLGALMRARNQAYLLSTQERKAAGEPDGTEVI